MNVNGQSWQQKTTFTSSLYDIVNGTNTMRVLQHWGGVNIIVNNSNGSLARN